jgi:hypothetical protein
MLANRYVVHAVNVIGSALWINQINSASPDAGVTLFEESSGSETDREFVAAKDVQPTLPIETTDLSVLTTIGFSGLLVSGTGLIAYARQLPFGGLPAAVASTTHVKMLCTDGLLVPVGISAGHNQIARLSLMLHGVLGTAGGSGATPFVWSANSAIATGAGQIANQYTTGPIKYTNAGGSRLVQGISNINVSFGLQVVKESSDGDVYPTHVSIIARLAKIEFTTKDAALIAEIGDGSAITAFASYFRNIAVSAQRVAPATATHIGITGTAGMITPGAATLQHGRPGEVAFTYTPVKNTNQLVISATSAIPTS